MSLVPKLKQWYNDFYDWLERKDQEQKMKIKAAGPVFKDFIRTEKEEALARGERWRMKWDLWRRK